MFELEGTHMNTHLRDTWPRVVKKIEVGLNYPTGVTNTDQK